MAFCFDKGLATFERRSVTRLGGNISPFWRFLGCRQIFYMKSSHSILWNFWLNFLKSSKNAFLGNKKSREKIFESFAQMSKILAYFAKILSNF